ncbi:Di-copper centre-containing protein [Glonium stellatum]|uniref:Di-copper centre-containing protein n=1 Tax=Glonium stellatum TaxID=574774 RepID=A0A8E2F7C8_9PEZI|nr:Di-copper centre-containing protein [Glonium stellatum]
MPRVRYSLQEIQNKYDTREDKFQLENLIRASRGIQELDSDNPDSFFVLAGYHGEPFRGPGQMDPDWWGGFCNHGNDALRRAKGCENVTLPFWDETFDSNSRTPIPSILTQLEFDLGGKIYNPLYSYSLREALVEAKDSNERYSTARDRKDTELHNSAYTDLAVRIQILNDNIAAWLNGTVQITPDPTNLDTDQPDTYSFYSRYRLCLEAPNYTVFSNATSATQWIKDNGEEDPRYVVSLESPHNAIHLAVGANSDMGDNETAGFDPLFFLHYCFIYYTFWQWQKQMGYTTRGSLDIIPGYEGTISVEGLPNIPPKTPLSMDTPLHPFTKADKETHYTSGDVTDISELGYSFGPGSLGPVLGQPFLGGPQTALICGMKRTHGINRADIPGSFVIRTYARVAGRGRVEIGRDAILSRWNVQGCANCRDKLDVESLVPLDDVLLSAIHGAACGGTRGLGGGVGVETEGWRVDNVTNPRVLIALRLLFVSRRRFAGSDLLLLRPMDLLGSTQASKRLFAPSAALAYCS